MFKKIAVLMATTAFLFGCSNLTPQQQQAVSSLYSVANTLVSLECGPMQVAASTGAEQVLQIVGKDNADVQTVIGILETNTALANQLCPGIKAIQAAVGNLPSGSPQVVTVPTSAKLKQGEQLPYPVYWKK